MLEKILKKIALSKTLDMKYLIWETTIDDNTFNKLKELGYDVILEHFNRYYVINW